jgi:hypothetical protein
MKPGDHPEFYRFPPPIGRSRESRIRLDAHGVFWNEGVRMEHPGLIKAFASWVRRHPDDGRFILSNQYDWTYFTVDDAPFFVRALELRGGRPWLVLTDGAEEPLDPASLMTGREDALYVRVKNGEFEAKFLPSAQSALVAVLDEAADGTPVVVMDGRAFPIGTRPA